MTKLTREELIERVQRIIDGKEPDEDLEVIADQIDRNVPYPDITELIFGEDETMTAEQIVDIAMSYEPRVFHMPAPDEDD